MNTSKMVSVNSVPENEGKSVESEREDSDVNVMAHINIAGRAVTMANAPITTNNKKQNCKDVESMKGKFSWTLIAGYYVPYIIRVINGELIKFVSVRMAETQLLSNYLHNLHADIQKCTLAKCLKITDSEAKLLNEINQKHTDYLYGKEMFFAIEDYIFRLEEAYEFYKFMEVCYKKLMCNITSGNTEKCGFIRINSESVVPYCIEDNQKYVPLFYFEGKTEIVERRAVKFENWILAYLKFCLLIQGTINELIPSDSCTMVNLDVIKKYFPPETNFEEYWPDKEVYTELLTNQKSISVNPPGHGIRKLPEVAPSENTTAHTSTEPAPVSSLIIPVMMTSSQNRRPPNQMSSTMSQGSGLGNFEQPPFLFRASSATPVIGNTVSYPNVVTISQRISTMYNPTTNGNVMSHSSQMRQFYNQHSNNNQAQHRQLQLLQIRQQQQIITTPHTQQAYSGQSVDGRLAFIQQRNALRNARSVTVAPSIETIDLLSPPSSPVPPTVQENPLRPNIAWGLTRIPERMRARDTSNNDAYESQMATLRREIQHQSAGGHFGATSTSIHTAIGGWYSTAAVRNIGPVQTLYSHHSPYPILLQNTYQSQRNWPPPPPYM